MNIVKAVKNGKQFKRKHWSTWLFFFGDQYDKKYLCWSPLEQDECHLVGRAILAEEDFLADDWEVKDETTRSS